MAMPAHAYLVAKLSRITLFTVMAFLALGGLARSEETADQPAGGQPVAAEDAPVQLPTVRITDSAEASQDGSAQSGYRHEAATVGPLGQVPLQDTPYSINVTSGELIKNQGARSEYEALKTNPAVSSLMESTGYSSLSRIMIRGFTAADQNDLRDGLVDRSFTFIPFDNVERIEVLNGLSSFLYGFSALGGTVNYITRQPPPELKVSADTGVYGGGVAYAHGEVGGPVAGTSGKLALLVNGTKEGGNTYLDGTTQDRSFVSAAMKYQVSPDTVLRADFWNQYYELDGLQSYINFDPSKGGVPSASDFRSTTQYGQSWTYNHSRKTQSGVGLDSKLSDVFTFRSAFRYADMWRDYRLVSVLLTGSNGSYSEKVTSTPRQYETTRSAYALMDADFSTWSLKHLVTAGYSGTGYRYTRGTDVTASLGLSSIYGPTSYADPNSALGASNQYSRQDLHNILLGDRVQLTEKLSLLGGGTYAIYDASSWGTSSSSQRQNALTPTLALMFKPIPKLTTYASYMEGLAAGGTAPSTYNGKAVSNAGQLLNPSHSRQYEVGSKATLGRVDLAAALFYIDKVNEYTDPSDLVYKQDGREVHQGLEFTATGKLTSDLTLVGGFTFLDARIEQSNDPTLEGKTPVNVPDKQARLYMEYVLPFAREFTSSLGAFYNGQRPVDAQNQYYMDESITFDGGLRYQTKVDGHDLAVRLNVRNIFDTAYWSYYRSGDGLFLGEPRTIALMVETSW